MLQIETAKELVKLTNEETILLMKNKLGGLVQTWHFVTLAALKRKGKGDSWLAYRAKFLDRFYKGKDESDFTNDNKITYEWSKAHPPSELLEQLSHFLEAFLKFQPCLSKSSEDDRAELAFRLLKGLTFEKLPPRIQKIAVSRNWKEASDFDSLTKEMRSEWEAEFNPNPNKAVNEVS